MHYAVYSHDGGALRVRVSSTLGAAAALEIVGIGPLTWRAPYHDWVWEGGAGGATRVQLTVRGVEGEVSMNARQPTKRR